MSLVGRGIPNPQQIPLLAFPAPWPAAALRSPRTKRQKFPSQPQPIIPIISEKLHPGPLISFFFFFPGKDPKAASRKSRGSNYPIPNYPWSRGLLFFHIYGRDNKTIPHIPGPPKIPELSPKSSEREFSFFSLVLSWFSLVF